MRTFLKFVIFAAVIAFAAYITPTLGVKTDMTAETGFLQPPDIDHGHGATDGHGAPADDHGTTVEDHGAAAAEEHGEEVPAHDETVAEEAEAGEHEAVEGEEVVEEEVTEEPVAEEAVEEEAVVEEPAEEAAEEVLEEPVEEVVEEPAPEPAAAAPSAPAGNAKFKLPAGMTATQTMATFSHAKHPQACNTCHHKWNGSGAIVGCAAQADCHVKPGKKEVTSYYYAFHKKSTSCVGCHKAEKKGPKACNDCHPK